MQLTFKNFQRIKIISHNLLKIPIVGDYSPIYQKKTCGGQPMKKPTRERQYGGSNQKIGPLS